MKLILKLIAGIVAGILVGLYVPLTGVELLFTVKNCKVADFEKLCKKNNFKVYRIGFVNSLGHLSLVKGGKVSNLEANGFIHKF